MKSPRTILGVVLGLAFLLFVFIGARPLVTNELRTTSLFTFELAQTPHAREKGLSGRTELPANYGMLFVFDMPGPYGFWMKDMFLPIDIVWLGKNGEVLGIEPDIAPTTYPKIFYPPVPVQYVLETRAGEVAVQGWKVGDTVELPK